MSISRSQLFIKKTCRGVMKNKLALLIFVVLLIYFIVELAIYFTFKDWSTRGTFGDSFGAINALFSGLAFSGLIFTIFLQKEELGLQREELKMTRNELKGQKEEFHIQNETLKIQRFENTFFQLLSFHNQIVEGISYIESFQKQTEKISAENGKSLLWVRPNEKSIEQSERTINGRAVFQLRYNGLYHRLKAITELDTLKLEYNKCYLLFQNDAGHYFRNLYRIIKFIDNSQLTFPEKYSYTSMVRAQLSHFELMWLYYNCISDNGVEKFKPLIETYTLFKNLDINKLANPAHENLYKASAFTRQN
jgi:hypothetical protein